MQADEAIKLNLPLRHWVFVLSSGKEKKQEKSCQSCLSCLVNLMNKEELGGNLWQRLILVVWWKM
jgi:hypothetical protein